MDLKKSVGNIDGGRPESAGFEEGVAKDWDENGWVFGVRATDSGRLAYVGAKLSV